MLPLAAAAKILTEAQGIEFHVLSKHGPVPINLF